MSNGIRYMCVFFLFFQAEDGIRDLVRSRGLGDVYKRQGMDCGPPTPMPHWSITRGDGVCTVGCQVASSIDSSSEVYSTAKPFGVTK